MPLYKYARFDVRDEARVDAERIMRELADRIRKELPGYSWTTYRDPASPSSFTSWIRADDARADERGDKLVREIVEPLATHGIVMTDCELVTSSDLQRRHRR